MVPASELRLRPQPIFFRSASHRGSPWTERKCRLTIISVSPLSRCAYARSSHSNARLDGGSPMRTMREYLS